MSTKTKAKTAMEAQRVASADPVQRLLAHLDSGNHRDVFNAIGAVRQCALDGAENSPPLSPQRDAFMVVAHALDTMREMVPSW